MAEGGEDQQWIYAKKLEEKNKNFEKEAKELKRFNDALASELITPELGQLGNSLKTVPLFWDENPSHFSGRFFVRSKRVLKIAYLSEGINRFLKTLKV